MVAYVAWYERDKPKGCSIEVNPNCAADIKKNFVNMLNNPQKMQLSNGKR